MKGLMILMFAVFSQCSFAQTVDEIRAEPPTYHDVAGSPFLLKDWSDGIIRFSSGRTTNQFKIKFDCFKNQVMLQFNGSSFTTESKVKEFVIFTKKGKDSMVFRKGFPPYELATEETFYQVAFQDKISLLHLYVKAVSEESQLVSKVIYRRIRDEDRYYILKNGQMIFLPNDRALIPDALTDQTDKIRQFISDKQLKMRDPDDFYQLAVYYNSLMAK